MLFGLAQVVSWRLGERSRLITAVSDELERYFAKRDYGVSMGTFVIGVVCVDAESGPLSPLRAPKYSKRDRSLEYDFKLDFESFLNAEADEAGRILGTAILDSLKTLRGKKIGDFDLPRFAQDLRHFLDERGWLLPGIDMGERFDGLTAPEGGDVEDDASEPLVPLAEEAFWSIIDASRARVGSEIDMQRQCECAAEILASGSTEEIVGFELTLRDLLRTANHFNLMAACKICQGYVSDDNYLYFRAGLILFGRDVFYASLEDPDVCSEALVLNTGGESVLYIADNAFMRKLGDEAEQPLPRELALTYHDYDLDTEDPAGDDWTEDELPQRHPRLWHRARNP